MTNWKLGIKQEDTWPIWLPRSARSALP